MEFEFPQINRVYQSILVDGIVSVQPMTKKCKNSLVKFEIQSSTEEEKRIEMLLEPRIKVDNNIEFDDDYMKNKIVAQVPNDLFLQKYGKHCNFDIDINDEIWYYNNIGFLCGNAGYCLIRNNKCIDKYIVWIS